MAFNDLNGIPKRQAPPDTTPDVIAWIYSAYATGAGGLTLHFANYAQNSSAAQFIPDTVNGDSIRIQETGLYHVTYNDRDATAHASGRAGITYNYAPINTNVDSIPAANLLGTSVQSRGASGGTNPASSQRIVFVGWLFQGDVLKINTDGGYNGSTDYYACHWSVKKIGGF